MTRPQLETNYSNIVQAIRAMLQAQAEYFQSVRFNYGDRESKLLQSKRTEAYARDLFKELHNNRPVIIEADIAGLVKEYNHYLDRCKVLLVAQFKYFCDTTDRAQLKKCKALEREMQEHIKKYLKKQTTNQPTLL